MDIRLQIPLPLAVLILIVFSLRTKITCQTFKEVSDNLGIIGGFGIYEPGTMLAVGAGLSFADFNNDGWDDITIATDKDSVLLFYKNVYGSFEKLDLLPNSDCQVKQVLWADIDNDGDKDLFITCYGDQNEIYENLGDLNLANRTLSSGITIANDHSVPASFGDIDRDGDLDLFVGNYNNGIETNAILINNGDFSFSDVSVLWNIDLTPMPILASSFTDINHDLYPELYLAIDKEYGNFLYLNEGGVQFADISSSSGTDVELHAMNSSSGDYDGDCHLDIYVTNIAEGSVLLRNEGDSTFSDVTDQAGVAFNRIGWATSFIDYDNDGDLDMYVSSSSIDGPNALYVNNGDATFSEPLFDQNGFEGDDLGWSFCNTHGDFNHDGLIDLAVSNLSDDQFKLWQNINENDNNWIKVDLEGVTSNRDGIGSWVHVFTGGKKHIRFTHLGDGYLGQSSDFVHVGIGPRGKIDSLEILWPSGVEDKYYDLDPNQLIKVVEGSSSLNPQPCPLIRYLKRNQSMDTTYNAQIAILAKGYITETDSSILKSGLFHYLEPGFEITQGGELTIDFDDCTN